MAKTSVVVDFRVQGSNEMASAIKEVGNAINSIDFEAIGQLVAVTGIMNSFGGKKITFDVETGQGVQKSIQTLRTILAEFNKIEEVRTAMIKHGRSAYENFENVSQLAVSIPPSMTDSKIHGMLVKIGKYKKEDYIKDDIESIDKLNQLAETLKNARKFIKEAGTEGSFLESEVKEYVTAFLNFGPITRQILDEGKEKYLKLPGMVGDTVNELFRGISQRVREQMIKVNQEFLKDKRLELKDAETRLKELNKSDIKSSEQIEIAAQNVMRLQIEVGELTKHVNGLIEANRIVKVEEKQVQSQSGILKNIQSAKVKAEIIANRENLDKIFTDIDFVRGKASAQQIAEAIKKREDNITQYLSQHIPYDKTPEERIAHFKAIKEMSQDILRYRELAMIKDVAVSDREFQAMQKGQSVYKVPQNLTQQRIDELRTRLLSSANVTDDITSLLDLLDRFTEIAKVVTPRQNLIIDSEEARALADYMILWRNVNNQVNSALKKARNEIIQEATAPIWSPEEKVAARKEFIDHYKGMSQSERDDLLVQYKAEKDKISKEIDNIKKSVQGLNSEEDKAATERLRQASRLLQTRKLDIEALEEANRLIKQESKDAKDSVEEKEKLARQKEIDKINKAEEARQTKINNEKLKTEKELAVLEEKALMAKGKRYDLEKVLKDMKEELLAIQELENQLNEYNLIHAQEMRAEVEGRTLQEQQIYEIDQELSKLNRILLDTSKELTEEEREKLEEKIRLLAIEWSYINENGAKQSNVTKEEIENQLKLHRITYARLQAIEKATNSHKTSLGRIVSEYLSMDKIVARMSFVWTAMFSYGIANRIKGIFTDAVNQAMELEKIVARITSIMSTHEKTFREGMKDTIREISRLTGMAYKEIGEAMYEIQSSNFAPEMTEEITRQAAKMAVANNASIQSASNMLISVLNTFKGEMIDLTQISDKLFKLIEFGRTDLDKLNNNFSTLSNTAALLGVNFDDIVVALSVMTNQGVNTDQAITSLNRLLMQFADGGSAEAQRAAQRLGVELSTQEIRTNGLISVIQKLSNATDTEIVALSGNVRAFKALASIIQDQTKFMEFYNEIMMSTGATQKAYNEVVDTTSFMINRYKQELLDAAMTIAEDVLPLLVTARRIMTGFGNLLEFAGSKFLSLTVIGVILSKAVKSLANRFREVRIELEATQQKSVGFGVAMQSMTKSAINAKAAMSTLSSVMKAFAPWLIVSGISLVVSKIWESVEASKEAKRELEELRLSTNKLNISAKEYGSDQLKRIDMMKSSIRQIEKYSKIVRDTTQSEQIRNAALEKYKSISNDLIQQSPDLFSFLDTTNISVNTMANEWVNVANGINMANQELDIWRQLVEAQSGYNVGFTKKQELQLKVLDQKDLIDKTKEKIKWMPGQRGTIKDIDLAYELVEKMVRAEYDKMSKKEAEKFKQDWLKSKGFKNIDYSTSLISRDIASGARYIIEQVTGARFFGNELKEAEKGFKQLIEIEKSITKAQDFAEENLDKYEELKRRYSEQSKRYLTFNTPSLQAGSGKKLTEKESTPSYSPAWEELKRKWEYRLDFFKRNYDEFAGQIEEAIEEERKLEQNLLDRFIAIRDNPKYKLDDTEREKLTMDFINWYWNWKKDKFSKVIKVYRERMDKLDDVEQQREIKKQLNMLTDEVLLGASQMMEFGIDTKSFEQKSKLRFDEDKNMVYYVKVIKKWADENIENIENLTNELEKLTTKQYNDVALSLEYAKNNQVTYQELIEKGFSKEYLKGIDFSNLADYVRDYSENFETSNEEIQVAFGILADAILEADNKTIPEEVMVALNAMAGGKWIADMEWILSILSDIGVDYDKWMKDFKDKAHDFKIKTASRFIKDISKEVIGTEKGYDELTAEDVEKFLALPSGRLSDDVVKALDLKMKEFEDNVSKYDLETQRILNNIKKKRNERNEYLNNLIEGKEPLSLKGVWDLTKLFLHIDTDNNAEEIKAEKQRLEKKLREEAKSLTEEQKIDIETRIAELDESKAQGYIENIKTLVSSLKETWEMYYDWQMRKIQEWYDRQTKLIDNRVKYEYRSSLWAEKQKEKLDKEKEARERKYANIKKYIAISEAIMNTAVAVMNMHKGFPPPFNFVMAAFMSAIGAAQVALIKKQKFAFGGYVNGASHQRGGVNIEVEGGEYVINKKATKKYLPVLEEINKEGLSGLSKRSVVPIFQDGGYVERYKNIAKGSNIFSNIMNGLTDAIKKIDIQVQIQAETLTEIQMWKKTKKGERLAKVM